MRRDYRNRIREMDAEAARQDARHGRRAGVRREFSETEEQIEARKGHVPPRRESYGPVTSGTVSFSGQTRALRKKAGKR